MIKNENPKRWQGAQRFGLLALSLSAGLLAWELATRFGGLAAFMLPGPGRVWRRLLQALRDGSLLSHAAVTLGEVLAGLALGVSAAALLGYLLAKAPRSERLLS